MGPIINSVYVIMKSLLRDKALHAILACGLLLFLFIPSFSLFSMRQVQELSITLSLSAISFILLVVSTLMGSTSIWRDIEKRYTTSVLGLPISRSSYVLGKFAGLALFIVAISIILGIISMVVISFSAEQYKAEHPILWMNIFVALFADCLKYVLLVTFALLFSTISTSFFFPFFCTLAVFLAGDASQEVFEYLSGDYGKTVHPLVKMAAQGLYYIIPNLSAFDLKVYAIYGLPLQYKGLGYTLVYFVVYTGILLMISVWAFNRKELN